MLLEIFAIRYTFVFTVTITASASGSLLSVLTFNIKARSLDSAIRKFDNNFNIVEVDGTTYEVQIEQL